MLILDVWLYNTPERGVVAYRRRAYGFGIEDIASAMPLGGMGAIVVDVGALSSGGRVAGSGMDFSCLHKFPISIFAIFGGGSGSGQGDSCLTLLIVLVVVDGGDQSDV
ncbi:hypothetical protein M0802_008279 [Mischocyttarus mexicanus]|nr:hypothetical protein M0802_008279 [Mischocyttarus mexicanus]